MKSSIYLIALVFIFFATSCSQNNATLTVQVQPSNMAGENIPASIEIELPAQFQNIDANEIGVTLETSDGSVRDIVGQVVEEEDGKYRLWWIIPGTHTDTMTEWKVSFYEMTDTAIPDFMWKDIKGKHMDLFYDDHKVFRYEYELDSQFVLGETLTAKNRVFYHIYDLAGERLITNGYEEGVWSHHRGIMIGWRDVSYQDQKLSFWGMEQLTTQKHMEFLELTAGPVLARVKSLIHWNDSTGTTLLEEVRTATIFHLPAPTIALIDFSSDLKAVHGDITLAGDPEHGGVQYRAHSDIAAEKPGSKKPTYYFNEEGVDPKVDHNLPWVGMSYGLDNKTYSVVEMSGAGNPKPAVWSAYRDYGRFGPYFKKSLADGESFDVNFRFLVRESEMPSREVIEAQYKSYINPPVIEEK